MVTLSQRRATANSIASKQVTQAGVDEMWSGIVAGLNASVPSTPIGAGRTSPRPSSRALQGQGDIDAMWGSIAADLNKKAGHATTVADRAR
jgi:hypothetical protein